MDAVRSDQGCCSRPVRPSGVQTLTPRPAFTRGQRLNPATDPPPTGPKSSSLAVGAAEIATYTLSTSPSASAGTLSTSPSASAGTLSTSPSASAGTLLTSPSASAGTLLTSPSASAGTCSHKPERQRGDSSHKPERQRGDSSHKPERQRGDSSHKPERQRGDLFPQARGLSPCALRTILILVATREIHHVETPCPQIPATFRNPSRSPTS
jgi:hypothetical protein